MSKANSLNAIVILLFLNVSLHANPIVELRDKNTQLALAYYKDAANLLNLAQEKMDQAEASNAIQGINTVELKAQIQSVQTVLDAILYPERKRKKSQVLEGRSEFYKTINTEVSR